MTFEDLELFWALAERQSVTEAARAVSLSQPTASRRLRAMEEELGGRLVDREVHPLTLTPFGLLFLDFADEALKRYRALRLAAGQNHSILGRLTVATSSSPAARVVTRWMADFIAAEPGVHLELCEMNTEQVETQIAQGEADIGFMGRPAHHPEVTAIPIAEDDIVLLVPQAVMPPSLGRTIDWEAARTLPFIARRAGSGTQQVVFDRLDELSWPRPSHIVLEVDTASAVLDAVESGLGAGFVSRELLFRRDLRHAAPMPVRGLSLTRFFYLAYNEERIIRQSVAQQFLRYATLRLGQRDIAHHKE